MENIRTAHEPILHRVGLRFRRFLDTASHPASRDPWRELESTNQEIRVIFLRPAANLDDPIHIGVKIVSLTDKRRPAYEAISYCWGDPADTAEVWADNAKTVISVTTNLHDALRRFRLATKLRILWADSICINQQDLEERSAQVRLMPKVYSNAAKVLAWLGEAGEDSQGYTGKAFEHLNSLSSEVVPAMEASDESRRALLERALQSTISSDSGVLTALKNVLERAYFTRIWPIQEVTLARTLEYFCGKYRYTANAIDMLYFGMIPQNGSFASADVEFDIFRPLFMSLAVAVMARRAADGVLTGDTAPSILLRICRELSCTDPRDKVYGVAGLITHWADLDIDYAKTTEEVYQNAAVCLFEKSQSLELLLHAGIEMGNTVSPTLPSWVPDWNRPRGNISSPHFWVLMSQVYDACPKVTCTAQVKPSCALLVKAIVVDGIGPIGPEWAKPGRAPRSLAEVARLNDEYSKSLYEKWRVFLAAPPDVFWDVFCRGTWLTRGGSCRVLSPGDCTALEAAFTAQRSASSAIAVDADGWYYSKMLRNTLEFVRPCHFTSGRLGQVPNSAESGDSIALIAGARMPFILRPSEGEPGRFRLVGPCYVHGIMNGEAIDEAMRESSKSDCQPEEVFREIYLI